MFGTLGLFNRSKKHDEKHWVEVIANEKIAAGENVRIEVSAPDDSRVDILTDEYAFEVDWASNKFEAVGQAIYYSLVFNRKPGVILLMHRSGDDENYLRAVAACAWAGVRIEAKIVD